MTKVTVYSSKCSRGCPHDTPLTCRRCSPYCVCAPYRIERPGVLRWRDHLQRGAYRIVATLHFAGRSAAALPERYRRVAKHEDRHLAFGRRALVRQNEARARTSASARHVKLEIAKRATANNVRLWLIVFVSIAECCLIASPSMAAQSKDQMISNLHAIHNETIGYT